MKCPFMSQEARFSAQELRLVWSWDSFTCHMQCPALGSVATSEKLPSSGQQKNWWTDTQRTHRLLPWPLGACSLPWPGAREVTQGIRAQVCSKPPAHQVFHGCRTPHTLPRVYAQLAWEGTHPAHREAWAQSSSMRTRPSPGLLSQLQRRRGREGERLGFYEGFSFC